MSYFQIIMAALAVLKEFLGYLKRKEECKAKRADVAREFRYKLKEAKKNGNSKDIEKMFDIDRIRRDN